MEDATLKRLDIFNHLMLGEKHIEYIKVEKGENKITISPNLYFKYEVFIVLIELLELSYKVGQLPSNRFNALKALAT